MHNYKVEKECDNNNKLLVLPLLTCRFLYSDGLHQAAVYLGAGVLEVHVGLLGGHPLHPVLPGEGHPMLDLKIGIISHSDRNYCNLKMFRTKYRLCRKKYFFHFWFWDWLGLKGILKLPKFLYIYIIHGEIILLKVQILKFYFILYTSYTHERLSSGSSVLCETNINK